MKLIIDLQYFAPIISIKNSIDSKYIYFEQYENWQKMSFRNRCLIPGANGLLTLSVPIAGGRSQKQLIKDIKIDNNVNWKVQHWRSIYSAYNRSPWFEYYRDELEDIFKKNVEYLWDWNWMTNDWIHKKISSLCILNKTNVYNVKYDESEYNDYRSRYMPNNYTLFNQECPKYFQVFEDKIGFFYNVSILDLLFCEGPGTLELLQKKS